MTGETPVWADAIFILVSLYGFRLHLRSRGWRVSIGRIEDGGSND